jgi:hypothetical protein
MTRVTRGGDEGASAMRAASGGTTAADMGAATQARIDVSFGTWGQRIAFEPIASISWPPGLARARFRRATTKECARRDAKRICEPQ